MLLAEDLLLLLSDDETGKLVVSGDQLDTALGGATLIDLSLAERVAVDERSRLVVLDDSPTGDEVLDAALAVVRDREGKKPKGVLGKIAKGLRHRLYERLAAEGVLRAEESRVLGLLAHRTWPAASVDHEREVRERLVSVLVQGATPEPREGALIALLHALRAVRKVVDARDHGLRRRDLDRRAEELAEGDWASAAVRQAIDAANAAIIAATTAAATSASTSS